MVKYFALIAIAVLVTLLWLGPDGRAESNTQPAAKDVMDRMMDQGTPVTPPRSLKVPGKKPSLKFKPVGKKGKGRKLLPEGSLIVNRRGRLIRTSGQWLFAFESDGRTMSDPPIVLLPNSWLEKMEADVAASPDPIIFRIGGEVTTYRGKNHLLLRKVLVERRRLSTIIK